MGLRPDRSVRLPERLCMTLENSDSFDPAETSVENEAAALVRVIENKEPPRKRYAAPSAPRVLRCMQTDVKS
jgi:hypothetical protein